METAVIGDKEYTKEEIIQIGKEHFDAAKRLRMYGIIIASVGALIGTISMIIFIMMNNGALPIVDYYSGIALFAVVVFGLIFFALIIFLGGLIILLSFLKSDEQEYLKAGVRYLNKQLNK